MKAYSLVPSFTGRAKATAPTHTMKYNSSTKKYSITLTDENNSNMPASAFNISGVTVTKSSNKYTFSTTTKISGTKACTYKANRTSGDQLVIWKSGNGSQTMAAGIDDRGEPGQGLQAVGDGDACVGVAIVNGHNFHGSILSKVAMRRIFSLSSACRKSFFAPLTKFLKL